MSIRTEARHPKAHYSRPYDRCGVEKSQMPTELRQKRRRRTESYRGKSHGREPQRNHQGIRRTVRIRRVHQTGCATDTPGCQINEPVPSRRHSHGQKRDQRQNCRIICGHFQIFNSVVCVRENKQRCQQYCDALHQRCDHSRLEQPQHRSNFQGVTAPVSASSSNARIPFSIAVGVGGQPGM